MLKEIGIKLIDVITDIFIN